MGIDHIFGIFALVPSIFMLPHGRQTMFGNITRLSQPPAEGHSCLDRLQKKPWSDQWVNNLTKLHHGMGPAPTMLLHHGEWTENGNVSIRSNQVPRLHRCCPQPSLWSSATNNPWCQPQYYRMLSILKTTSSYLSEGEGALLFHSFSPSLLYTFPADKGRSYQFVSLSIFISVLSYLKRRDEYPYRIFHSLFTCLAALSNRLCKRGETRPA